MTDMRYMDRLEVVAADAVGLIREKTATYGDSWKRRGGPGAWFTIVRPIDRLEGIVAKFKGDIFDAINDDPTGQDGSALACVRDIMNYCILIEAHARAAFGVGPHGPAREAREEEPDGFRDASPFPPQVRFTGSPENGSHHALAEDVEEAGEVTQDTGGAGGSAYSPAPRDALEDFERSVRALARNHHLRITCSGGDDGLVRTVRILGEDKGIPRMGNVGHRLEQFFRRVSEAAIDLGIPLESRLSALGEITILEVDHRKVLS